MKPLLQILIKTCFYLLYILGVALAASEISSRAWRLTLLITTLGILICWMFERPEPAEFRLLDTEVVALSKLMVFLVAAFFFPRLMTSIGVLWLVIYPARMELAAHKGKNSGGFPKLRPS